MHIKQSPINCFAFENHNTTRALKIHINTLLGPLLNRYLNMFLIDIRKREREER